MNDKVAEVIEATSTGYTAESYELYDLPPLGSLVKTLEPPVVIYGVVCRAGTNSIEPGRRPVARGKDAASEEAVYQSNPQLSKLLRSEFETLVVGHATAGKLYYYLPPKPARIHSFVYPCTQDEIQQVSGCFDFLSHLLEGVPQMPEAELIAAVLREMVGVQDDKDAFLVAAGKALTAMLGKDYQRLRAVLGRLKG